MPTQIQAQSSSIPEPIFSRLAKYFGKYAKIVERIFELLEDTDLYSLKMQVDEFLPESSIPRKIFVELLLALSPDPAYGSYSNVYDEDSIAIYAQIDRNDNVCIGTYAEDGVMYVDEAFDHKTSLPPCTCS